VIENATIKATDLRLRFEFGGDISSVSFNSLHTGKNLVIGKSGKLNFRIELPYRKFGDYQGHWSTGGDEKNKWIDFVIYSGIEKEFNFGEIQEAVLGFLFSLKAGMIPETAVEVSKMGEYLNLKWNSLSVNALTKPYEERATLVLK
jgi:hypothetical protein